MPSDLDLQDALLYQNLPASCSDPGLQRMRSWDGLCTYESKRCSGVIRKCPACGYNYCEYHLSLHSRSRVSPIPSKFSEVETVLPNIQELEAQWIKRTDPGISSRRRPIDEWGAK
ncbi:hypothetical protein ES702_05120 [subsurface metagenome]